MFHVAHGLGARRIFLEISEHNLRTARRKGSGRGGKAEIVWAFPPVIPESAVEFYQRAARELRKQGFRKFQVGNLGHLSLLSSLESSRKEKGAKGSIELYGTYTMNLLNSQALRAALDIGVRYPQFSVESDGKNAGRALHGAAGIPVSCTAFGYLPLFTSRMDHPSYRNKGPVTSPKGERFHWIRSRGLGHLLPDAPLSLLSRGAGLARAGFAAWIIDFSFWPPGRRMPASLPGDVRRLARILPGSTFNFSGNLE
jgi:putative protease